MIFRNQIWIRRQGQSRDLAELFAIATRYCHGLRHLPHINQAVHPTAVQAHLHICGCSAALLWAHHLDDIVWLVLQPVQSHYVLAYSKVLERCDPWWLSGPFVASLCLGWFQHFERHHAARITAAVLEELADREKS